jgi:hypothetical protein
MKKVLKVKTKLLPFSNGNEIGKYRYTIWLDNSVTLYVQYYKTMIEKEIGVIDEDMVDGYEPDEEVLFEMLQECMEVDEGLWD